MSIEKLTGQAASMEEELSSLLDLVNHQRREFHALNYFTTQQLLQIRREFGNLKQFKPNTISAELYSLLMSFSLTVTSDKVNELVEGITAIFSEQEANAKEQASIEEPLPAPAPVAEDRLAEAVEYSQSENQLEDNTKPVNQEMHSRKELEELILKLSPDEEYIFEELRGADYSKIVSYKAVKHAFSSCTNGDEMLEVAMDWCLDNADTYNDTDVGFDTSRTVDNKDIVNEVNNGKFSPQQIVVPQKPVQKESINIKHPVVQQLLDLGFSPNLAVKGATLFNGDFDLASEWCLSAETEDGDTQQPLFGTASNTVPLLQYEEIEVIARLASVMSMFMDYYCCNSAEWKETWDEASAIEYMGILETAAVLEQIHDEFAGNASTYFCVCEALVIKNHRNIKAVKTLRKFSSLTAIIIVDPYFLQSHPA